MTLGQRGDSSHSVLISWSGPLGHLGRRSDNGYDVPHDVLDP